ncbi:hypothetical protein QE152_g5839 [Popillia japonica]|uniref:Uncharacterized protein n=1 Tax=Popillia japonica TaxID=7064 RepID=A0AAW1MMG7_POPJA
MVVNVLLVPHYQPLSQSGGGRMSNAAAPRMPTSGGPESYGSQSGGGRMSNAAAPRMPTSGGPESYGNYVNYGRQASERDREIGP